MIQLRRASRVDLDGPQPSRLARLAPRSSGSGDADLIESNGWALSWLALAFGVAICLSQIESGRQRWGAAAWTFALQIPGSPASWGAVILVAGIFLIVGKYRGDTGTGRSSYHFGCGIAFYWFCALAASALIAFVADLFDSNPASTVNPCGGLAWVYLAYIYRERYYRSRKPKQPHADELAR